MNNFNFRILRLMNFPEPNSFYAENIQKLYSLISVYSIVILSVVFVLALATQLEFQQRDIWPNYTNTTYESENWLLEGLFILFPFVIVILLVYPSFALLYSLNEVREPELIVKVTGHQWFWKYEVTWMK